LRKLKAVFNTDICYYLMVWRTYTINDILALPACKKPGQLYTGMPYTAFHACTVFVHVQQLMYQCYQ